MKKRFLIILTTIALIPFLLGSSSYNYSHYGNVLHSTPGLNYAAHYNRANLGVEYGEARDFVIYEDHIYMVTSSPTSDRNYTDYLIVMDSEFNVLPETPVKEFELSDSYAVKVRAMVNELFTEIDQNFIELFTDKVFYPGSVLPFSDKDPFIGIADSSWETDTNVVSANGSTINETDEVIKTTINVTYSVWSSEDEEGFAEQKIDLEYEVNIGTLVEGISTTSSVLAPSFNIEPDTTISNVNSVVGTDFNEDLYETMLDFVSGNDETIGFESNIEIPFENFIVTYSKREVVITDEETEEETTETEYYNITVEEVIEAEIPTIHSSLFEVPYTLNTASGIDVVESGIYIADRRNNRIVKLNHNYEVIDAFYEIDDPTFDELAFEPLKVAVDPSERMNVVAHNIYEGILELDYDGSFNRYTGVNPILLTPAETLRRLLMTETQRQKLQRFLPTEYTNVALNDRNFIFASAKPREDNVGNMIQLINPKGLDVLIRNGYHVPMGDIIYLETIDNNIEEIGPSTLVDVAVGKHGMYTVLDEKRSRIFTYDEEGNLLYINGSSGSQSDKFSRGVAINYLGDDLLLLDATGTIIVYRPTAFGNAVNKAIELHSTGRFEDAATQWEEVLRLNTNYEIAYNGIGKYHLRLGNYKEAMDNFRLGHDKTYYSKAFKAYRNEILKDYFGLIVLGLVALGVGIPVFINRKKIFKRKGEKV